MAHAVQPTSVSQARLRRVLLVNDTEKPIGRLHQAPPDAGYDGAIGELLQQA